MSALNSSHLNVLRMAIATAEDARQQMEYDDTLTKCVTDMMLDKTSVVSEEQLTTLLEICPTIFSFLQAYGGVRTAFIESAAKAGVLTKVQLADFIDKSTNFVIDRYTLS